MIRFSNLLWDARIIPRHVPPCRLRAATSASTGLSRRLRDKFGYWPTEARCVCFEVTACKR